MVINTLPSEQHCECYDSIFEIFEQVNISAEIEKTTSERELITNTICVHHWTSRGHVRHLVCISVRTTRKAVLTDPCGILQGTVEPCITRPPLGPHAGNGPTGRHVSHHDRVRTNKYKSKQVHIGWSARTPRLVTQGTPVPYAAQVHIGWSARTPRLVTQGTPVPFAAQVHIRGSI